MSDTSFRSSERVDMRPIEEDDLEFLRTAINDPRIWRAIGRSRPVNRDQEREFYETVVCDDTVTLLSSPTRRRSGQSASTRSTPRGGRLHARGRPPRRGFVDGAFRDTHW